ncbi:MAG: sugar phosphate isomerase/epimerase [Candidatus Bathyarchaeia archaeon]|nr:sugar phosphate isomerase/epimerase [Candidatus Bathyarchaeota archaeon]
MFYDKPLKKVLRYVSRLGYESVEIPSKDYSSFDEWNPSPHMNVDDVLKGGATKYKNLIKKFKLSISALSDHERWHLGPDPEKKRKANDHFKKTVEAAQALDVPVVVGFTGCPDWSAWFSWPPTNVDVWEYGWREFKEVWGELSDFALDHDVKIAHEVHPQNMAYNLETAQRMFEEVPNKSLGINFDPCEYYWQRIDPVLAIYTHRDRIYHCHAKDIEIVTPYLSRSGVCCTGTWDKIDRGFRYRTVGWGDLNWKKLITALIQVGYNSVLSYEHEDPIMSAEDGAEKAIRYLTPLLIQKPVKKIWW